VLAAAAQLMAHAEDRWYGPRRSPGAARARLLGVVGS
jgi:hypothetical protein